MIRRSGIAGRRATISGGAIRRGRTAAGARTPEDTDGPEAAVEPEGGAAEDGAAARDAAAGPDVSAARDSPGAPDVRDPPDGDRFAVAWDGAGFGAWARAAPDRWTVGDPGPGFPVPVPPSGPPSLTAARRTGA
ncbi:hypothetical protein GTY62_25355, partial [Streptomyces sp. SID724]|nr:hypothetical protein [Streptomyces sp. SID724]